jgi:hypothetical protein
LAYENPVVHITLIALLLEQFSAASNSLKAIAKPAFREPAPLDFLVRALTVALNVLLYSLPVPGWPRSFDELLP